MGLNLLHAFALTIAEDAGVGGPGQPAGPNEWNASHQLYLDSRAVTATTDTINASDLGALVHYTNASAIAVTLGTPVAGAAAIGSALGFYKGWFCFVKNYGAGAVTITPTSATINGLSTLVLATGAEAMLVSDGVNYKALIGAVAYANGSAPLPKNYFSGFITSNDGTTPNTVIDIAAGQARDTTDVFNLVAGAFTKSIAGSWVAGSGANGMGTGLTATLNTWYWLHAILLNTGAVDFFFDTEFVASHAPAGVVAYRPIWPIKLDGSVHILPYTQVGDAGLWASDIVEANAAAIGTSAITLTLAGAPPGAVAYPFLNVGYTVASGGGFLRVSALSQTDVAPAVGQAQCVGVSGSFNGVAQVAGVPTNTSAQVRVRGSVAASNYYAYTSGFTWRRGRDG